MRQVVTQRRFLVWGAPAALAGGMAPVPDTYRERLLKYVPVETVIAWIAVFGSASAVAFDSEFFPCFARWALILGAAGTWLYLQHVEEVRDGVQLAVSTLGFVVWVHAFAVLPFAGLAWYNPVAAALLLPAYTALAPLADGIRPGPAGAGGAGQE